MSNVPSLIRLLIVDDHEIVRRGLQNLFQSNPHLKVVGEAGSMAGAVAETVRLKPDVVLLDVRLPDGSGIEACRQIQKLGLETRVLVLTAFADDKLVSDAIFAGADGYLLKEINGPALIHAIEEVAAGKSILDPSVTRRVLSHFRLGSEVTSNKLEMLSAQEKRVLALVAEGKTNKEIATDMGLSDKTVKNYLSNLMDKLNMSRRSQAAAYFVQHSQVPG